MKRYIAAVLFGLAACLTLSAQNIEEEGGDPVQTVGSEVQVDSTLDGHTIFQVLPDGVAVNQSPAVRSALERQIESNSRKQFSGFRIRIYFDSTQDARDKSLAVLNRFKEKHPDMSGYRSYESPNFKVTVGNFRNRTEADAALETVKREFPSAFVVRERFKYPSVGRYNSTVDSLNTAF